MFGIRKKAAHTAKRAGLITAGLLFCSVGSAFLTVAAWLALTPVVGVQTTALIIASVYLGIGLIMIGLAARSHDHHEKPTHHTVSSSPEGPPIVQAFMYGLQAGARAEGTRH